MTFDQLVNLVLEQSNPIQPVNLPSPAEKTQKQQAFQQQQQKSIQDVKNLGSGLLDVAKFLDPTGILSWDDVKKAQEAFKKDPSGTNGLLYMLAIGSVIPAVGKGPKALKTAIRGGEEAAIRNSMNNFVNDLQPQQFYQYAQRGLDPNQARMAYEAVLRDQQRLVDELQSRFPKQRIPTNFRNLEGSIQSRWKKEPMNGTQVEAYADSYVDYVNNLFKSRDFNNTSDLVVIDYKIISGGDGAPRQIVEFGDNLTGHRFLMYSASGTGAPDLKAAGKWSTIPGFSDITYLEDINGQWVKKQIKDYFIKNKNSVNLTKGGNRFLTQLANYLENNGVSAFKQY